MSPKEENGADDEAEQMRVLMEEVGWTPELAEAMLSSTRAAQAGADRGHREPSPVPHAEIPVGHLDGLLSLLLTVDEAPAIVGNLIRAVNDRRSPNDRGDLYEEIVGRVPRFLNHSDHRIAENAATVLRRCSSQVARFPDLVEVIEDLARQVDSRRIGEAREAAATLACLLSTRPREYEIPSWDGKGKAPTLTAPWPDTRPLRDLDQRRPFDIHQLATQAVTGTKIIERLPQQTIALVVKVLRENVCRPEWKQSSGWGVESACCVGLAFLGYRRPDLVEGAVDGLLDAWKQREGPLPAMAYALTSIGYAGPELLPEWFIDELEAIASGGTTRYVGLRSAAQVGVVKIGHAPPVLAQRGVQGEVEEAVDGLVRFFVASTASVPESVHQAFATILEARPEELVSRLVEEVEHTASEGWPIHYYDGNLMYVISQLAAADPRAFVPLLEVSPTIFKAKGMHHDWYDWGGRALGHVLEVAPDKLPKELGPILEERLETEGRASVQTTCRRLLDDL